MSGRRRITTTATLWRVVLGTLGIVSLLAVAAPTVSAQSCPNEAVRAAQGATFLPECRAFELVSPPGNSPEYGRGGQDGYSFLTGNTAASASGSSLSYYSVYPDAEDHSSGGYLISRRGPGGWATTNAVPPQSTAAGELFNCPASVYFSAELTSSVLADGNRIYDTVGGSHGLRRACERDEPALIADEPEGGFANLFMHEEGRGYELLNITPAGEAPENAVLQDVSSDFKHVVFSENATLVGNAARGYYLYESSSTGLRMVSDLPTGAPVEGEIVDGMPREQTLNGHVVMEETIASAAPITHAVSSDGERVFFTAEVAGSTNLYLRENASQAPAAGGACSNREASAACTVQVDAGEAGSESGGGQFLYASADGARVFFLDERRLTSGATALGGKPDLYEYDVEAPEGMRLRDLTVDDTEAADVLGFAGASEDGNFLYFVADAALTGPTIGATGVAAEPRRPNLYLLHEGTLSFIATLSAATDSSAWAVGARQLDHSSSAASPNGQYLAVQSLQPLAGAVNQPAAGAECGVEATACAEVFLYSAEEGGRNLGSLACVSCGPGSADPTGQSELLPPDAGIGSKVPLYRRHVVLENGTVFFESANRLVPYAESQYMKVYQYRNGKVALLSNGSADGQAIFDEASESGQDVFFVTPTQLVPTDTGQTPSIYDARVDGGFEAEYESQAECQGERCLGAGSAPLVSPALPSLAFEGPGNIVAPVEPPALKPTGRQERPRRWQRRLRSALRRCRRRRGKRRRAVCKRRARRRLRRHRHKEPTGAQHRGSAAVRRKAAGRRKAQGKQERR